MQQNPFFDDLAKLASSAGSTILEWRKEMETMFQQQIEKWSTKMDFVSRSEFEAVREMAQTACLDSEKLKKRLDALEGKDSKPAKKPLPKTSAAKKATAPKKTTKTTAGKGAAVKTTAKKPATKKATTNPAPKAKSAE